VRGVWAERLLSIGVLAFGIAVAVVTARLPAAGGYARIGPNFMPAVVGGGLIVLGIWLLAETATGGWRKRISDEPEERGDHAPHRAGFAWVTAGLVAQIVLINTAGFVLAAATLFSCVARGFGSRRWARDIAVGLVLALAIFFFFVRFLNVNLPAGWLYPLLGGAGI
jgi:putative tricarboxylic transport membrane protein